MGTIMEYLDWRGDLNFSKDPFNHIDALVLAMLSYLPFKDIVPGTESRRAISLKDVSTRFFSKNRDAKQKSSTINPTASPALDSELMQLFKKAAACPRFENIRLSNYEEHMDFVVGQQFAAVTYTLPGLKRGKVVAFRGTDNTMIGWKEDFEIACMEQVPAQQSASRYLKRAIGIFSGRVIVCGHSKGGNLAVYASSRMNRLRRNKLAEIINFDGPGFDFSIIPAASFSACENKVCNYVPEESIVGMLLEPVGKRSVVSSSSHGIEQHNALNWKVACTQFMDGELSGTTRLLEQTLKTWLADFPVAKRKMFIEALFDILGASEGRTIDPGENIKEMKNIFTKYSKLDNETKALLSEVFSSLTEKTRNTLSTSIKANLAKIK